MVTPAAEPLGGVFSGTCVGTWLSLVEHSLGVGGVGSSNLPVPTIFFTSIHSAAARIADNDPPQKIAQRSGAFGNKRLGGEARGASQSGSSNLPVPTIFFTSIHSA